MSVLPFRWQGRTRREQLRTAVQALLDAWLEQWSVSGAGHVTQLDAGVAEPDGMTWACAEGAGGSLYMRLPAGTAAGVGNFLAGVDDADSQGLAEGIGRRALLDLVAHLTGAGAKLESLASGMKPPPAALEPKRGVLALRCSLGGYEFECYLDCGLCDSLVPVATKVCEPLVAPSTAVLPSRISLDAVLDLGTAALADTISLKPGEIIKTDIPLDAEVSVRAGSAKTMFSGLLAAADGHRAVRCTNTTRG